MIMIIGERKWNPPLVFRHSLSSGTWKTLKPRSSDSTSFLKKLTAAHLKYDTSPFFELSVGEHPNVNTTIIQLKPTELGMPSHYYTDTPEEHPTIFEYKQFLAYTITLLGEKYYDGLRLAELIFQYEKKIAYIVAPFRDLIPPSDLVEVMTIADIKRVAEHIPLMELLQEMSPNSLIKEEDQVHASYIYVRHISNIISATDEQTLHDYLLWRIIRRIYPYVSGAYDRELKKFESNFKKTGVYSKRIKCPSMLYDLMPLGISQIMQVHNDQHYSTVIDRRGAAEEVFEKVKNVLIEEILSTPHDYKIRLIKRMEKLNVISGLIGRFTNENTIDEYYKEYYVISHNYVENVINLLSFRGSKTLFLLNKSFNYTERISMYTVSSNGMIYDKSRKMISIPHYLIELPYFDKAMPLPVKYGRLGTMFGRAIAYSFAQHRDELSYLTHLLMKYVFSRTKWIDNIKCIHELSDYYLGKEVIGATQTQITYQNNMFHLIGFKFASLALQDTIESNNIEIYTPGLEKYGQEGVFLLSYIQDLCTTKDESFNTQFMVYNQRFIPQVFLDYFPLQVEYDSEDWCKPSIDVVNNYCD